MATTTISVSGMTCGHCVNAVKDEIGEISGVTAVDVDLVAGGTSKVTIESDAELADGDIAAAVDEAGYEIVS